MNRDTKCRRVARRQHFARSNRSCSATMSHRAGVANYPSEKKDLFFPTTFHPSRMVSDEVVRSSSRNVSIYDRDLCLVDSVGLAARDIILIFFCAVLPPSDVLHRSLVTQPHLRLRDTMTQLVHGLLEPRHHLVTKHNVCVPPCGRSISLALLRSMQLTRGLAPTKSRTVQARRVTPLRTPVDAQASRLGPYRLFYGQGPKPNHRQSAAMNAVGNQVPQGPVHHLRSRQSPGTNV